MKNKVKIFFFSIIFIIILVAFLFVTNIAPPAPEREDVWIPENLVVVDSTAQSKLKKAYLFYYNMGAFGFSTKMISVVSKVHKVAADNACFSSDYISSVDWLSSDTLMISLRAPYGHKLLNPIKGVTIVIDSLSISYH